MFFLQHVFLLPTRMMDVRDYSETRRDAGRLLWSATCLGWASWQQWKSSVLKIVIFPSCLVPKPQSPLSLSAEAHSQNKAPGAGIADCCLLGLPQTFCVFFCVRVIL